VPLLLLLWLLFEEGTLDICGADESEFIDAELVNPRCCGAFAEEEEAEPFALANVTSRDCCPPLPLARLEEVFDVKEGGDGRGWVESLPLLMALVPALLLPLGGLLLLLLGWLFDVLLPKLCVY
jgi:hypothetical protein